MAIGERQIWSIIRKYLEQLHSQSRLYENQEGIW